MRNMEQMYAQPHEGISGTERGGDPLLTEDGSLVASELMGMLYRAVLVGNPAPVVREMYERMDTPIAGDAVVVLDSIYRRDPDTRMKGVGYLIEHRAEWAMSNEQWADAIVEDESLAEGDRWVEQDAWYVQYGPQPADVCRWSNCRVVAIPRPPQSTVQDHANRRSE